MRIRPGHLPWDPQDRGGGRHGGANLEGEGAFLLSSCPKSRAQSRVCSLHKVQGLSRGCLTSFRHLAPAPEHSPGLLAGRAGQGGGCPRVRAGERAGERLPPSSCSADCHSPGKQTSGHSLLSSAFTLAMPKSLLLSHSIPRNAHVLWPVTELMQLERGWLYFFSALLSLKKKKKS